jgi:hypothetical protein
VAHPGLTNLRQYPAMLGHRVRAVPACQRHDSDPLERFGHRGVIVEIAMYCLDTFWRRECGRVADEGANLGAGSNKDIQCRASDLACRRGNEYHDSTYHFRVLFRAAERTKGNGSTFSLMSAGFFPHGGKR